MVDVTGSPPVVTATQRIISSISAIRPYIIHVVADVLDVTTPARIRLFPRRNRPATRAGRRPGQAAARDGEDEGAPGY
jgi:hypothetical protein